MTHFFTRVKESVKGRFSDSANQRFVDVPYALKLVEESYSHLLNEDICLRYYFDFQKEYLKIQRKMRLLPFLPLRFVLMLNDIKSMRHITNNGRIEIKDIALPLPAGKVARSLVCVSLVDSLTEYLLESVSRERERERESNTHSCMTR